jgi:AraC family transcriptional activator of pobA
MDRRRFLLHFSSNSLKEEALSQQSSVPHFALYEESTQDVELLSLHVEPIPCRSSMHDWSIRPHAHPHHHQILLLATGGGTWWNEGEAQDLVPGTILTVPAMTVHAFRFHPGSDGHVATVSLSFLQSMLNDDPALAVSFGGRGECYGLGNHAPAAAELFRSLQQEFIWSAPGRRSAIAAYLQLLMVTIARQHRHGQPASEVRRRDTDIVARFRHQVERNFRWQPALPDYAKEVGVTTGRLNAACRAVMGHSALALIHERLIIEAKRALLYTDRTVGEIAGLVGFADPAYFNRFFRRHTGTTPGEFRCKMGTIDVPGAR